MLNHRLGGLKGWVGGIKTGERILVLVIYTSSMNLSKKQSALLILALLLGVPMLLLSLSQESPGSAVGTYIAGFVWGAIIAAIVNGIAKLLKKDRPLSITNWIIGGGLIANAFTFLFLSVY